MHVVSYLLAKWLATIIAGCNQNASTIYKILSLYTLAGK